MADRSPALKNITMMIALCTALCGCTGTPYLPAPEGKNPVGYRSAKIAGSQYLITFTGNPRSDQQRVRDFALLRAAEVTKEAGFTHFRVDHEDHQKGGAVEISSRTTSVPIASDPRYRQYRSDLIRNERSIRLIAEDTQIKHALRVCLTITVGEQAGLEGGFACNADEIIRTVTTKYRVPRPSKSNDVQRPVDRS